VRAARGERWSRVEAVVALSFPSLLRSCTATIIPEQLHPEMAFAAINSTGIPIAAIEEAFVTEPSLKKRVYDAIGV